MPSIPLTASAVVMRPTGWRTRTTVPRSLKSRLAVAASIATRSGFQA